MGRDAARFEVVGHLRREVKRLRGEEETLVEECERRGDRIAELEREIERMRHFYQGVEERKTQHVQAVEERLKLVEGVLATRFAEPPETHTFLPITDRLSEVEVLSIVRSLNECIYQIAVTLTEEWEKLELPPATSRMDADATSRPCDSLLLHLVRNRNPMGLTFLLQSCLCSMAVDMTSGWELGTLNSVYDRLSASGKCNIDDPG